MLTRTVDRLLEGQRWLEPLGDALQKFATALYRGTAGRAVKTLLNGTWLGHPLHPVLTDVPLGTWTLAVVFDIISLFNRSTAWRDGATLTIAVGIIGALGAALTGFTDWADTIDRERRVGLTHGLLNTLAVLLYVVSILIRVYGGSHGLAVVISWIGYLVVLSAAWLGGEMVFNIGTGVNHHAWQEVPTEWAPTIPASELPAGKLQRVEVHSTPILLYRIGETICAISDTCSHAGGPLNEGTIEGKVVICPWHASRFDYCTGEVHGGPATISQVRYEARVQNGQIEVRRSAASLQPN
jgi:nitrite reductase/ring-hydroxylating ferredoxin subunit/uncharacterized membrane protein